MRKFLKSLSLGLVVAFVGVLLCACVPSNLEKAEARMKDAGYKVITVGKEAEEDAEGLVGGLVATKGDLVNGYEIITAMLFDSKDTAKKYYDKMVKEDDNDDDTIVKQSGKWVFAGTETAIEDFGG